ncbi:hypothetical protein J4221_00905 [Candidatus Pacearchaeota archaeon]|nr:hypothetical protein [Candidatus Pacearchaeota archaeon]
MKKRGRKLTKKNSKLSFFRKHPKKEGALELSIGTVVILVLAMSMLILGLILIRSIFQGAQGTIDITDEKVKAEINKLFVEDQRAVIHLPNRLARIKQGNVGDVAFAIQNNIQTQKFRWQVVVDDENLRKKCGVTERQAEEWMTTGSSGNAEIPSGQKYYDVIRFNILEGAVDDVSQCIVRYKLSIKKEDGSAYETIPFDVDVE